MRRLPAALGVVSLFVSGLTVSSGASTASAVTTTISDVTGASLSAPPGSPSARAMVSYTVTQQASAALEPGAVLPGAIVDRDVHQGAYGGLWGGSGFLAGWMGPAGSNGAFEPEADFVESSRFRNRVKPTSSAIPAGSSWPFAMAQLAWDAPAPFDRAPSATPGVLAYETSVSTRRVSARHGGKVATLDVAFFRADLVARGGDVDARHGLSYGPIVVDLGAPFASSAASYSGAAATLATSYVGGFNMALFPSAGKVAIYANLKGVIREAREYTLPSGMTVNEWHLPIMGVVVSGPIETDELEARYSLGVGDRALREPLTVAPAWAAPPAPALEVMRAAPSGDPVPDPLPPIVAEIRDAAVVDATLDEPVELTLGNGNWSVQIDPDFQGVGVLGLKAVTRRGGSLTFADAMAVPFVDTARGPVRLERSRLKDLRVMPFMPDGRWYLGASGGSPLFQSMLGRALDHHGMWPALQVEAVYDLGAGLEAHVMFTARQPQPQPHLSRAISAGVLVRSLSGARAPARPIQYLELPATGPVRYDGQPRTSEFSAPLDLLGAHTLSVGELGIASSYGSPAHEGIATVVAPGPLAARPVADPERALGGRVAVYLTAPDDLPFDPAPNLPPVAAGYGPWMAAATSLGWVDTPGALPRDTVSFSFARVEGAPPKVEATPKPIGTPCGPPQVVDIDVDDADPAFDLKTAWLDADGASLYATMRVRRLPAAAPAGQTHDYVFQWRHEHIGYYARGSVDAGGAWRFDFGLAQSADFYKVADVTGDVKLGDDGLVRVAVPRTAFDVPNGQPLRFTVAWAQRGQSGSAATQDHAPHTSTYRGYGHGGTYAFGQCSDPTVPVIVPR